MMFAVASVKRAETAFPGLHGAVEVVTRGLMRLRKNLTNKQLADKIVQTNARLLALNYMFEDSGKIIQFALFTKFVTDPQEPPKPIRMKKALTDRFKTRLDERLAENERKQAEKQAEPDMEETWDLSDPADPLNIGMGWGTGGHGLGL